MTEEMKGLVQQQAEEALEVEMNPALNPLATAGLSVVVENGEVVVDNEFSFPIRGTVLYGLLWDTEREPVIRGIYQGMINLELKNAKFDNSGKFHIVRIMKDDVPRDILINNWKAVEDMLTENVVGSQVMMMYLGYNKIGNEQNYHNIMVGIKR